MEFPFETKSLRETKSLVEDFQTLSLKVARNNNPT